MPAAAVTLANGRRAVPVIGMRRGAMASTNEDAAVLATARSDDGRLLIMRHLPDRGTIEIAWWQQDKTGAVEQLQALELAAEEVEVDAFARLCDSLVDAERRPPDERREAAAAVPLSDGAELKAVSSGESWILVRQPDPGSRLELSPTSLRLLVAELPKARRTLETLGFGLPQQMR
jgi:hypothetical protein